jgi:hypothetical protein
MKTGSHLSLGAKAVRNRGWTLAIPRGDGGFQ